MFVLRFACFLGLALVLVDVVAAFVRLLVPARGLRLGPEVGV